MSRVTEPVSDEPIIDDENPEWTEEDFARAQPAHELPHYILRAFPKTLEALAKRKVEVTLVLGQDVVSFYQSRSDDWQDEIDRVLRKTMME